MTEKNIVEVIRVVRYYGEESAVREAIQKSLPLGAKECRGYTMTIGEHLNELPEILVLTDDDVEKALEPK